MWQIRRKQWKAPLRCARQWPPQTVPLSWWDWTRSNPSMIPWLLQGIPLQRARMQSGIKNNYNVQKSIWLASPWTHDSQRKILERRLKGWGFILKMHNWADSSCLNQVKISALTTNTGRCRFQGTFKKLPTFFLCTELMASGMLTIQDGWMWLVNQWASPLDPGQTLTTPMSRPEYQPVETLPPRPWLWSWVLQSSREPTVPTRWGNSSALGAMRHRQPPLQARPVARTERPESTICALSK